MILKASSCLIYIVDFSNSSVLKLASLQPVTSLLKIRMREKRRSIRFRTLQVSLGLLAPSSSLSRALPRIYRSVSILVRNLTLLHILDSFFVQGMDLTHTCPINFHVVGFRDDYGLFYKGWGFDHCCFGAVNFVQVVADDVFVVARRFGKVVGA